MKLVLKVLLVFLPLVALLFYFTRNKSAWNSKNITAAAPASTPMAERFVKLAALPRQVQESSGIAALPQQHGHYLTHNDSGGKPYLFQINEKGEIEKTIELPVSNHDWEDLTMDKQGNAYISDTGNNDYDRDQLVIYKVNPAAPNQVQEIRFSYGAASEKEHKIDAEALFWYKGHLYLTTKDRDKKRVAQVYQLPDQAGTYEAKKIGAVDLKDKITGAAVSPEGDKVALLGDGMLYLFRDLDDAASFYKSEPQEIDLDGGGQTEGVTFKDEHTLVITSEGGNLYQYSLR
ncbi:hypothetical protein [Pontibacter chitinilyticus]|uniref:hypothetical protein n=1 Tax=Pontibacter chitinilyticus TaxID=2674989 RepID=UPI00321AD108